MQIVIDIPKGLFIKGLKEIEDIEVVKTAIKNGTPLPKGHGRLIDADALENYIKDDADEWDDEWDKYAIAYVKGAPTIIEADKE